MTGFEMTKEELEIEAEEKYREVDREFIACQDEGEVFNIGYVLGAEPREKRIAELEDKLANADYQLEGRDIKIKELEAQIEKMKCCGNCYYFNISKDIGIGNLFCDLKDVKNEYCKNKDHWKFLRR